MSGEHMKDEIIVVSGSIRQHLRRGERVGNLMAWWAEGEQEMIDVWGEQNGVRPAPIGCRLVDAFVGLVGQDRIPLPEGRVDVWLASGEALHVGEVVPPHAYGLRVKTQAQGRSNWGGIVLRFAPPTAEERVEPLLPYAICWCDLETTGLEPREHRILELSYVLTTFRYPYEPLVGASAPTGTYLVEGGLHALETRADAFVREMHKRSGLETALGAAFGTSLLRIEQDLLALSAEWPTDKDRRVMLGGNTAHFDLGFLRVHMPEFAKRLSHRVFDASGFYRQCLSVGMPELPKPVEAHRARADVERSIELARECARWLQEGRT